MIQKKFLLLFGILCIGFAPILAQKSAIYTHELEEYNRALGLYKESQYQSAQIFFDKILSDNKDNELQLIARIIAPTVRYDSINRMPMSKWKIL